ncbi:MAG TPA: hypothetical protein VFN97_05700 [Actinospica sp.]|nr:hypothetical protein [Actinospica sp.]
MTDTRIPDYESASSMPEPSGMARVPRPYAHSNATRLLSAGAYLEKGFRAGVIRELVRDHFRVVAPSYGYDAVTVLAHALAARSLRRKQLLGVFLGEVLNLILWDNDVIGAPGFLLIAFWLPWAFAFLRRVATMQALITWLSPRPESNSGAADYEYDFPANRGLTPELVEKIAFEQSGGQREIVFARERFRPFVGAGWESDDWTTAALLSPMKADPTLRAYLRDEDEEETDPQTPPVVPFTVAEISEYVAQRLESELRDDAPYGEQIENLVVERRRYSRAGALPVKKRLFWKWRGVVLLPPSAVNEIESFRLIENREQYDAAREYLCIRVGAWNQEVVTSIFVGFDVRGNTLYSEFYPHVMPPVQASFHLVDRLPQQLRAGMLLRMAIGIPLSLPRQAYGALWRGVRAIRKKLRAYFRAAVELVGLVDNSDFRLGRYSIALVDTGALVSLRELAASPGCHHFFQEADRDKYVKIVQRRLLEVVRDFLIEHNIDVYDHDARGTTILDKSTRNYGDAIIHGDGVINQGGRGNRQSFGRRGGDSR